MNAFLFTGFFMGTASLFLAVLLFKYGTNKIHYTFAFQNLGIATWGFSNGFAGLAKSPEQALIWWEVGHIAAFYLIVFLVHHALLINKLKQWGLLLVLYAWATAFPILCIFGMSGMKIKYTYLKYAFTSVYFPKIETHIFLMYVVMWVILAGYVIALIIKAYGKSTATDTSLRIYRVAYPIGLIGGGSYPFMLLGINYLYPYSQLLVPLYCGLMAYSIVRHKLFNIDVIIKKTLVFTGLFAASLATFILPILFIQEFMSSRMGFGGRILSLSVSALLIILTLEPIKNFLEKATDKYLFQKKYDTYQILKSFINNVVTVLDINKIMSGTSELLEKVFHPENIAILLLDNDGDRYVSQKVVGHSQELILEKNSAIPDYLIASKNIFSIEDPNNTKADKDLLEQIKNHSAHLSIPLLIHNDLIGIILLGKKKSDEYYTSDDLNVLSDLAKTEAIAISNSKTHALLLQAQQKEEQSNRLLSLAYLVTNLSHELRNPLNLISGCAKVAIDTVAFKAKDLPRDEGYQNILSLTVKKHTEIMEISKKASDMLNAILNSMKIDKSKFIPVDLRNVVHEAMKRADADARSSNIKLLNNISHDFTKINGDYITLEQVFFNLIHNAVEAMVRNGKGDRIEVRAVDMSKKIKIEIADNGPGIPKHDLERIFEPFYTTKDNLYKYTTGQSKGAGLGLTIVNNNVKSHGGIVHVESEEGKGTTFVVELPKDGGISNG